METSFYKLPNIFDPLRWEEVFGRSAPVEVDVGSGKGGFLLWAALTYPDRNFLGIERLLLRLRKVEKKIRRLNLTNVRQVRLEASYLIGKLIPPASVAAYHIYFPDPWPKRRHSQRRLFQASFVADLRRTLEPAGVINVATDHEPYFRQIESVIAATAPEFTREPALELPVEARTEFEREFLAAGRPIWRARWRKPIT